MRRLLPLLLLAACGGGDGLSGGENYLGTYQVTLHQRNVATATTIPCTDFGPDTTGEEMYLKIVQDDFFDDPNLLEMETCDTDPAVCDFSIVHFEAHGDQLVEDGWSYQGGGGEGCALSASRNSGTLVGTTLRIETFEWYATTAGDCSLDDAEALIGTPDCERNEAWEATRL